MLKTSSEAAAAIPPFPLCRVHSIAPPTQPYCQQPRRAHTSAAGWPIPRPCPLRRGRVGAWLLFVRFVRVVLKTGPVASCRHPFLPFCCLIPASPCPSWSYCCTYLTVTDKHERSGRGTHPDVVGAERNLQRELKSASRAPIKNMSQNQLVVWVVLYGDATEGTRVLEVRSEDVEW